MSREAATLGRCDERVLFPESQRRDMFLLRGLAKKLSEDGVIDTVAVRSERAGDDTAFQAAVPERERDVMSGRQDA